MTDQPQFVTCYVAGVDTHADTHWAAILDHNGTRIADQQFDTTPTGYRALILFITSFGLLTRIGIEGTSSYGAALTRMLLTAGIEVCEVIRPRRARRHRGKSDPDDAYRAAQEALANHMLPTPKTPGAVDAIKVVLAAYRSAVKARAEAITQLKSLLITAPTSVREQYRHHTTSKLVKTLACSRPTPTTTTETYTRHTLKQLAKRIQTLTIEINDHTQHLETLVTTTCPQLREAFGCGVISTAQLLVTAGSNPERLINEACFAALCGCAPIPASSGKTNRWRYNRGGDRQANTAIWRIAITRLTHDPKTQTYINKKLAEGKTKKEAIRALKRHICREIYKLLTHP